MALPAPPALKGNGRGLHPRLVLSSFTHTPRQKRNCSHFSPHLATTDGYGTLQARLWASSAQIAQTIKLASSILGTNPRQNVTAAQRADLAVQVAAAKVNIVDFGLDVTSKLYELQGARSVSGKYGFDVAWRDLRTHSLHDPIAHKRAEVGRYALFGPGQDGWPTPTWYT